MSVTTIQSLWTNKISDLDLDATVETIDANAAALFAMEIDNSANTIDSFIKLFNDGTPTLGAITAPFPLEGYRIPASDSITVLFDDGGAGFSFSTALTAAAVTTGGNLGTTSPSNPVTATFLKD